MVACLMLQEIEFTSASVKRRGSKGTVSGGHSHCSLWFTDPCTNLYKKLSFNKLTVFLINNCIPTLYKQSQYIMLSLVKL